MMGMGGSHRPHMRPIVGTVQPAHEFRPDAAADQAAAFFAQAFARDDEHDPKITGGGAFEEPADSLLGSGESHAMQVERGFGRQPASRQGT